VNAELGVGRKGTEWLQRCDIDSITLRGDGKKSEVERKKDICPVDKTT